MKKIRDEDTAKTENCSGTSPVGLSHLNMDVPWFLPSGSAMSQAWRVMLMRYVRQCPKNRKIADLMSGQASSTTPDIYSQLERCWFGKDHQKCDRKTL
jgi:hypothetical protein